jgi:predicted CoA-binding protein
MEPQFRSWYERTMLATPQLREETRLVQHILRSVKTIAIVGISKNEHRDSHYVGRYLQRAGYKIIPVNPTATRILGEQCYADLASLPFPVDVVNVFRKPEEAMSIVQSAVLIRPKVIWLQLGVGRHDDAFHLAWRAGCILIQNRCMKVDHQFLIRNQATPLITTHTTQGVRHEQQRETTPVQV